MSNALFHKKLLKNYQILERAGTFIVSVAYDITTANLYTDDEYPRYLIPLRVIPATNLSTLYNIMNDRSHIEFGLINNLFITGAIFDNDELDIALLPVKGEEVVATFEYIDDKLLCTHIKLIDRETLFYVDIAKVDIFYKHVERLLDD